MTIKAEGLDLALGRLDGFSERRLAAAIATGLTRTAVAVRGGLQRELSSRLDRPMPYTVTALRYTPATAASLSAYVGFDINAVTDIRGSVMEFRRGETPASKYLQPQVRGGERALKRAEKLLNMAGWLPDGWVTVPGQGARLDAYGNMERGQIIQILSQLRINALSGFNRDMSFNARSQLRAQRRAGGRFFVLRPGGKAAPGVYQRETMGGTITPVLMFVRRAQYRQRFDFYGLGGALARRTLGAEVQRAIAEQQQRLMARRAG